MRYKFTIQGTDGILMHCGFRGLDPTLPIAKERSELAKKRSSTRTEADDERLRELECETSLWLDEDGNITIPDRALRACIENAARKSKEGPAVREGVTVEWTKFIYDKKVYGSTIKEVSKKAQYTVPVAIQKNRINRTRARFDNWSCEFIIDADDEVADLTDTVRWVRTGGRRIGIGDWRPQKSGKFGRFTITNVEVDNGKTWTSVLEEVKDTLNI